MSVFAMASFDGALVEGTKANSAHQSFWLC
jgi:hypothetical protein